MIKYCLNCGKEFNALESKLYRAKYCSVSCKSSFTVLNKFKNTYKNYKEAANKKYQDIINKHKNVIFYTKEIINEKSIIEFKCSHGVGYITLRQLKNNKHPCKKCSGYIKKEKKILENTSIRGCKKLKDGSLIKVSRDSSVVYFNKCIVCKKYFTKRKPKEYKICSNECKKINLINKFSKEKIENLRFCKYCNCEIKNQYKKVCKNCTLDRKKNAARLYKQKIKISKIEPINSKILFEKDNWTCRMCGTKVQKFNIYANDAAEVDHIIPISRGGTHTWDNVQTLCKICNVKKSNKTTNNLQL